MKNIIYMNNWLRGYSRQVFAICMLSTLIAPGFSAPPATIEFNVDHFSLQGVPPSQQEEITDLLQSAEKKKHTLSNLQSLAKEIEQLIRADGYSFYRVVLPPQSLNNGEIFFKLIEFTLGSINISGNEYFDDTNIIRSVPELDTEKSINTEELAQALKFANQHPSKQVRLTFKQSEEDKVDAEINVAEQRPYNISLIMNNAGTRDTGFFRMTAAVQHNNLWNMDHSFNASYTTSPEQIEDVVQYGFNYNAPIYPLRGWLSAYYVNSDINTGVVAGGFDVSGSGEMYGFSYQQYLPRIKNYQHWLTAGIDDRFFDNNIQFEFQQIGTDVRSTPFHLGYKAQYQWETAQLTYNFQWATNVGLGGYNSQRDYTLTRLGATKDWNVYRYGFDISKYFGQWLLKANFTGQYTPDLLIPGEQIGLGGTYSVRGYMERETSADRGETFHLELYTPAYYGINLVTFFDYGHGNQTATLPEEIGDWNIGSLGFGFRYQWKSYIYANFDLAFALYDAPQTQDVNTQAGNNRIHASLVFRY